MTNSTPKSNKIERQGSPNGKKWTPQTRKTVTYFASTASKDVLTSPAQQQQQQQTTPAGKRQTPANNNNSGTRQTCSPSNNRSAQQPVPRSSPMRYESPRGSPTNNFYAGAKFSEPPSPAMLPKPPSHWTGLSCGQQSARMMMLPCNITQHFSKLINLQA